MWFSDAGAEEKIINYLEKLASDGTLLKGRISDSSSAPTTFLDLGTGNGHLLFSLRDNGWEGHMLGVDYSYPSINFARSISLRRVEVHYKTFLEDGFDFGSDMQPVHFEVYDVMKPRPTPGMLARGFDVLLDKGTFDAVSLSWEVDDNGKRIPENYPEKVKPLLRNGGLLIITSCNWTEEELEDWFTKNNDSKIGAFVLRDKIKYKKFSFGGKSGQSVATLCFEKRVPAYGVR